MKQPLSLPYHRARTGRAGLGISPLLLLTAILPPAAPAQTASGLNLDAAPARNRNRVGLGVRFGFNIRAEFKGMADGSPGTLVPGPEAGGGVDRIYDNGYVRPDETYPNNLGATIFWGYTGDQVNPAGTEISFQSASPLAGPAVAESPDDRPLGLELAYARELGAADRASWGLELGFGYTDLEFESSQVLSGSTTVITDIFSLGGIIPPAPGYQGPFSGRNVPAIDDTPSARNVSIENATASSWHQLEANLYGLRLGPYLNFTPSPRLSLGIGAGAAVAILTSDYSFSETTTTALGGPVRRTGSDSKTEFLAGAYVAGQAMFELSRNIFLFGGVQFESLSDFSQSAAGKEASLDLGQAIFVKAGLSYSF